MKIVFNKTQTTFTNGELTGLCIASQNPQKRHLLYECYGNVEHKLVVIPYLHFLINYTLVEERFIYPGVYGNGLKVALSYTPLQNSNDIIYESPTDQYFEPVCTNHSFDSKKFLTLEKLVTVVSGLWYTTVNSCPPVFDNWENGNKAKLFHVVNKVKSIHYESFWHCYKIDENVKFL